MKTCPHAVSRNPLITREDLRLSLTGLMESVSSCYTPGGLYLGNSGAHFSPRTALMEGWSRTIWGLAPFLAGGGLYADLGRHLDVLRAGTNPENDAYWGIPPDRDQRFVEMAAIALALLLAPEQYWNPLSETEKINLASWLSTIQDRQLPANNWHFFRILTCAALKSLGLPVDEQKEKESFDLIESCYRGGGWYEDGSNHGYDLYNPFAFHFYGLLYARFAGGYDPERARVYTERARLFAPQFLPFFRADGSLVAFGRSLTYRFAAVSFFSACAFAGIEALPMGVMKGIVLRNLRWWYSQPILDSAGILTVGYAYPNLIMAEQYNSPGSPYWALKTYLPLALEETHPFWKAQELPLPEIEEISHLPVPGYILSRGTEDVQLLAPGRYPGWEGVQAAAKYCKFAYSARFGFSVSHSNYSLEKTGGDSSLLLSEGDNYWRERRHSTDIKSGPNWVSSRWKPWPDVEIESILISLGMWHVRIHRIHSGRKLESVEGGFSVPRYQGFELPVPSMIRLENESAAVAYPWGASRIVNLEPTIRSGEIVRMEPNLNIMSPSGEVPVLRCTVNSGDSILACAVRAGDSGKAMTEKSPHVEFSNAAITVYDAYGKEAAVFTTGEKNT